MARERTRFWLDRALDYAVPSLTLLMVTRLAHRILVRRLDAGRLVTAQVGIGIPVYKTTGYAYRRWLRPVELDGNSTPACTSADQ